MPDALVRRGSVFLREWEQRFIQDRESVVVTTRCGWCDWHREGPMGENRDLMLAHRLEAHPEIKPPKRTRRIRPGGQVNTAKSLDENIQNARTQGASTWAGEQ